ncbi:MAG: low-specificity L-threonine aldolase [Halioglobus sp.]
MTEIIADFRSDTVTRPSAPMLQAMLAAELGDDVYGDDPTVNHLEGWIAASAGKEAALLCPSGTQSNLVALMAHCQRGDEYIVGQEAHTYKYEAGGGAVLGSIQPQPIEFEADSTLDLDKVKAKLKAKDSHFARSRLLCLENTRGGDVLPLDYHARAANFCAEHGLALHLDGARLFNAIQKQDVALADITQHYDSVSLCISKGLGAPAGSLLVGSQALIDDARRWRKMLGGGMRQAGLFAAACQYALEHNVDGLLLDHDHAQRLAQGLAVVPGIRCDPAAVQTNMVFIGIEDPAQSAPLTAYLAAQGIVVSGGGRTIRLVTHLDIDPAGVDRTIEACAAFFA